MKNLISMTDFVISQWDKDITREDFAQSMIRYATFLLQPLELWMFIPCDEDGNILGYPRMEYYDSMTGWNCPEDAWDYQQKLHEYLQAKEKCLFNGCVYDDEIEVVRSEKGIDLFYIPKAELFTIEILTKYNLQLTQTAIKQINP